MILANMESCMGIVPEVTKSLHEECYLIFNWSLGWNLKFESRHKNFHTIVSKLHLQNLNQFDHTNTNADAQYFFCNRDFKWSQSKFQMVAIHL